MELGEWIGGWIIENSDNRGLDNGGSTVILFELTIQNGIRGSFTFIFSKIWSSAEYPSFFSFSEIKDNHAGAFLLFFISLQH